MAYFFLMFVMVRIWFLGKENLKKLSASLKYNFLLINKINFYNFKIICKIAYSSIRRLIIIRKLVYFSFNIIERLFIQLLAILCAFVFKEIPFHSKLANPSQTHMCEKPNVCEFNLHSFELHLLWISVSANYEKSLA